MKIPPTKSDEKLVRRYIELALQSLRRNEGPEVTKEMADIRQQLDADHEMIVRVSKQILTEQGH